MAKRERPPCSKCGKAPGTRKGGLCSPCEKKSLGAGIERRKVADLKPHPLNQGTYRDGPDPEMIQSLKEYGLIKELDILPDGLIVGGRRRWAGCKVAGIEDVNVKVHHVEGEDAVVELIVLLNQYRKHRTNELIGREAELVWAVCERRAAKRSGSRTDLVDNCPPGSDFGKARESVGKLIGVAGRTAHEAREVVRKIDDLEDFGGAQATALAAELRERLEESVRGAWEMMRSWSKTPAPAEDDPPPAVEMAPTAVLPTEPVQDTEEAERVVGDWTEGPPDEDEAKAGLSPGAGGEAQQDDAPAPALVPEPEPEPVMLDGLGIPLPPESVESFFAAAEMAELAKSLKSSGKAMGKLAKGPAGALLRRRGGNVQPRAGKNADDLRYHSVDIANAVLALEQCMPACCRCPHCHAVGSPKNRPSCTMCEGRPYVTAYQLVAVERKLIDRMIRDLAAPGQEVA